MPVFIRPTSMPWIEAAETAQASAAEPVGVNGAWANPGTAVKELRSDYSRVTRLVLGLVGAVLALVAIGFIGFGVDVATGTDGYAPDVVFAAALFLLALMLGSGATLLLVLLHRSGRRLTRALAFWMVHSHETGVPVSQQGGPYSVRFLAFQPYLLVRVATAALAMLATIIIVSMVVRTATTDVDPTLIVIGVPAAVLFATVMVCQFAAVQRIVNAHLSGQPKVRRPTSS